MRREASGLHERVHAASVTLTSEPCAWKVPVLQPRRLPQHTEAWCAVMCALVSLQCCLVLRHVRRSPTSDASRLRRLRASGEARARAPRRVARGELFCSSFFLTSIRPGGSPQEDRILARVLASETLHGILKLDEATSGRDHVVLRVDVEVGSLLAAASPCRCLPSSGYPSGFPFGKQGRKASGRAGAFSSLWGGGRKKCRAIWRRLRQGGRGAIHVCTHKHADVHYTKWVIVSWALSGDAIL